MSDYAVFLEPQGGLKKEIVSLKNLVDKTIPGQKYCNHPPHCTIIVGAYQEPDKWMNELQESISTYAPFPLNTDGFHVFYNDQQAGGGHTVVIRIVNAHSLFHIQASVGEILSHHKENSLKQANLSLLKNEPFKTSMERYGFPFVGDYWFPHFSIASLKMRKNSLFLKELLQQPVSFTFTASEISIWKIEGDYHIKLHTIYLKGISKNATQS